MKYHAHIYFSELTLNSALSLQQKMKQQFEGHLTVYDLRMRPVGPHPLPMFEANFSDSIFENFIAWLKKERGEHVILIHQDTGYDLRDHTEGATWLGGPLALDFDIFDT